MKKKPLVFIVVLSVMIFVSCKPRPDLTEDEVYSIVNEIIKDDSLYIDRVCWKFQALELTDEYKKEFVHDDIAFIERQNELFKNVKVKPNKLKWYKRFSKTSVFTTVDSICDQGILYHISFPLISADRQKVIIEFQEDCNCMLGGQGGKDLYEKRNGHWVRTKSFEHWISNNKNPRDLNNNYQSPLFPITNHLFPNHPQQQKFFCLRYFYHCWDKPSSIGN